MCSETSPPRLSFSHDFSEPQVSQNKQDHLPHSIDTFLQDSNSEFVFSTSRTLFEFDSSSSADELFSNGVILPIQIQEKTTTTTTKHIQNQTFAKLPPRPSADKIKKETIRELLDVNSEYQEKKSHHAKSFWGFSRSKSLNCDRKKNLVCSLPLLSRSNSTGSSVSNPKKLSSNKSCSYSYSCSALNLNLNQKGSSGKSYGGSCSNGLMINPVLNVPIPCVSKGNGANLFGLGSFLRVGKVKKGKK